MAKADDIAPQAERLHGPLTRLLRPLVRLAIRSGMTFPALADLLRELYVNVAEHDFALSDKEQTLAVHGFPREELVELALALPARAVDRFAKFGEALSFAPVWDGQDLITTFSRNILLPNG